MLSVRTLAALCIVSALCASLAHGALYAHDHLDESDDHGHRALFYEHAQKHKWTYPSPEEHRARYKIFRENLRHARWLSQHDQGTAQYGATRYSDRTHSEQALMLSATHSDSDSDADSVSAPHDPAPVDSPGAAAGGVGEPPDASDWGELPDAWDWVAQGKLPPVAQQGSCGACWAHAVAAHASALRAIQSGNPVQLLSAHQLLDCVPDNRGCRGGDLFYAFRYLSEFGAMLDDAYPPRTARAAKCEYNASRVAASVGLESHFTHTYPDAIRHTVVTYGPPIVAFNGHALFSYNHGVMDLPDSKCNPKALNHAVTIVGYAIGNETSDGVPYWTIRNTWGAHWGEDGYFRTAYRGPGPGVCGMYRYVASLTDVYSA